MLHSGRQEYFLSFPSIRDSSSKDFVFDFNGQLCHSGALQRLSIVTVASTKHLIWPSSWILTILPLFNDLVAPMAVTLSSRKTFDVDIATLSLDLRCKA